MKKNANRRLVAALVGVSAMWGTVCPKRQCVRAKRDPFSKEITKGIGAVTLCTRRF
jgi:hypothetical protein